MTCEAAIDSDERRAMTCGATADGDEQRQRRCEMGRRYTICDDALRRPPD